MKYITEEELRDLYNIQAFETFTLTEDVRVTPGGRQFLADRKIPILVHGEKRAIKTISVSAYDSDKHTLQVDNNSSHHGIDDQCLEVDFELLEAIFLNMAMELYERNQALGEQIYGMMECLESIACNSNDNIIVPNPCDGMTKAQLKCPQKKCFKMNSNLMFSNQGKEVTLLNLLRCKLRKFYVENDGRLTENQKVYLSYLINRLSQIIHRTLGNEHCTKNAIG